jgi:hypothetical protein
MKPKTARQAKPLYAQKRLRILPQHAQILKLVLPLENTIKNGMNEKSQYL